MFDKKGDSPIDVDPLPLIGTLSQRIIRNAPREII